MRGPVRRAAGPGPRAEKRGRSSPVCSGLSSDGLPPGTADELSLLDRFARDRRTTQELPFLDFSALKLRLEQQTYLACRKGTAASPRAQRWRGAGLVPAGMVSARERLAGQLVRLPCASRCHQGELQRQRRGHGPLGPGPVPAGQRPPAAAGCGRVRRAPAPWAQRPSCSFVVTRWPFLCDRGRGRWTRVCSHTHAHTGPRRHRHRHTQRHMPSGNSRSASSH